VILTAGSGTSSTPLGAFDAALLDAGIGDFNLIQVSSIVPAGADVHYLEDLGRDQLAQLSKGAIVPVVYSAITSDKTGEVIAAALAVGIPRDRGKSGVIFEAGLIGDKEAAEQTATRLAEEALRARGLENYEIRVVASELTIVERIGCAVSAAVLLPDERCSVYASTR